MSSSPVPTNSRWMGAGFVVAAILFQTLWLGLPALFLSVALVVSYALWISTDWQITPRLRGAFILGILIFLAHVTEEFITGFQQALPGLFNRAPWTSTQYLVFNGVWALIFFASAITLRPGRQLPVFIILFFAVAGGVGNGVVHLLLVLQRGDYFPGAWTAVFCLAIGIRLLTLLYSSDSGRSRSASR